MKGESAESKTARKVGQVRWTIKPLKTTRRRTAKKVFRKNNSVTVILPMLEAIRNLVVEMHRTAQLNEVDFGEK